MTQLMPGDLWVAPGATYGRRIISATYFVVYWSDKNGRKYACLRETFEAWLRKTGAVREP